jgi:hypothetical protein
MPRYECESGGPSMSQNRLLPFLNAGAMDAKSRAIRFATGTLGG